MITKLNEYIKNVKSKKIKTGLEIRQAIERYENDLKQGEYVFDEQKANKAISFIGHLKHFTGIHNNKNFELQPWQVFIIANIFGWVNPQTGLRRFKSCYLELGRKNGKTALAAAISLYTMIADGEANAEVILAANSREQAKICFDMVSEFTRKLDPQELYMRAYRNEVKFKNNHIKIVASDSSKLDGLNASVVILDEYHAAKSSKVYDVLRSSQVMREQSLFCTITTAGFDKKSPCYELRKTAKDILEGVKKDDTQFIAIYTLDSTDDWTDPKVWVKSNPNLDITTKSSALKDEINAAKNNISLEVGVKTKNLNIWCETISTWISDKYVYNASKKISFEDIKDPINTEVIVGVDLSNVSDITAVAYMFIQDEKYNFIVNYYLPEDSLNSATDKEFYKVQHSKGNITLTPGNRVDYNFILSNILETNKNYYISKLAYDTWNSTQFAISATDNNLHLEPYSQSVANFNRPTCEFERLILGGDVVIDDNDVTRWMLGNVYLRSDSNGNVKPDKTQRSKKIDGITAMLMCLGTFLTCPRYNLTII